MRPAICDRTTCERPLRKFLTSFLSDRSRFAAMPTDTPVAVLTTYDPRSSARILAGSRPTAAWEAWSAAKAADHPS